MLSHIGEVHGQTGHQHPTFQGTINWDTAKKTFLETAERNKQELLLVFVPSPVDGNGSCHISIQLPPRR
jgi:hypothetical protein